MRYIDADKIKWHDLRENGLHEASDMIAFKDEVDKLESFPAIADIITVGEVFEHKLIPIEWIEEWEAKQTEGGYSLEVITDLLDDWRKLNGD